MGFNVLSVTVSVCGFRGIRYLSKHCAQRYAMIGDLLSKEQYDVALLQEVRHTHTLVT